MPGEFELLPSRFVVGRSLSSDLKEDWFVSGHSSHSTFYAIKFDVCSRLHKKQGTAEIPSCTPFQQDNNKARVGCTEQAGVFSTRTGSRAIGCRWDEANGVQQRAERLATSRQRNA